MANKIQGKKEEAEGPVQSVNMFEKKIIQLEQVSQTLRSSRVNESSRRRHMPNSSGSHLTVEHLAKPLQTVTLREIETANAIGSVEIVPHSQKV